MADRRARIQLEIQGRSDRGGQVPLRTFVGATSSLTDLLTQLALEHRTDGGGAPIEWFVRDPSRGGTVVDIEGVAPATDDATDPASHVVRAAVEGLRILEDEGDVRGLLSTVALERVRSLVSLLDDGAGAIIVRGIGHEVALTAQGAERAAALIEWKRSSIGSVEGAVDTVSVREPRPYFMLVHAFDARAIKCVCDDTLLAQAQEALSTSARVRVSGRLTRRFDGRVDVVDVARLQVVPGADALPQPEDVRGIEPEFTGGLSLAEWRRRAND